MRDESSMSSHTAESKPSYEQMKKLACGEETVKTPDVSVEALSEESETDEESGFSTNFLSLGMIIFCAFLKF